MRLTLIEIMNMISLIISARIMWIRTQGLLKSGFLKHQDKDRGTDTNIA